METHVRSMLDITIIEGKRKGSIILQREWSQVHESIHTWPEDLRFCAHCISIVLLFFYVEYLKEYFKLNYVIHYPLTNYACQKKNHTHKIIIIFFKEIIIIILKRKTRRVKNEKKARDSQSSFYLYGAKLRNVNQSLHTLQLVIRSNLQSGKRIGSRVQFYIDKKQRFLSLSLSLFFQKNLKY